MKRLVVLASVSGSNFQAMLDNMNSYNGEVVALIVDRKCNAIKRAQANNIPVIEIIRNQCKDKGEFDKRLLETIKSLNADYYLLAGFMSILSKEIVKGFPNKIINIHPSLLPSFPGVNAISQAVDYGVKITGCTIHFVDEGMDTGPIIAQNSLEIGSFKDIEEITQKIHEIEHRLYIEVIKLLCEDSIIVVGRMVEIRGQGGFDENQKSTY